MVENKQNTSDKKILFLSEDNKILTDILELNNHGYKILVNNFTEFKRLSRKEKEDFKVIIINIIDESCQKYPQETIKTLDSLHLPIVFIVRENRIKFFNFINTKPYHFYISKNTCVKSLEEIIKETSDFKNTENSYKMLLDQLKTSRDCYDILFNNPFCGMAVYKSDSSGNDFMFIDFNKTAEKIENTDKEEIIGKKVTDVFPGVTKLGLLDVMKRVNITGKPEHLPISMYKDKRIIGWRDNFVHKLSSGEIITIYKDATKSMKNEIELRNERDLLRGLLDNLPLGITLWDGEGNLLNTNKSFTELTGYCKKDVETLKLWFEKAYPDNSYRNKVMHAWDISYEKDKEIKEFEITCKNGEKKEIEFRANFLPDKRAIVSMVDVTERKKFEEQIKENEEKWRGYVENAPFGIFIVDENGNYISVNPAACRMTGKTEDELLKINLMHFCPKGYEKHYLRHFNTLKETGKSEGDLKYIFSDSSIKWWSVNSVKLSGNRYIGFAEDITKRKKMELKLQRLTERMTLATNSAKIGIWDFFIKEDKLIWDSWCYKLYEIPDQTPIDGYSFWEKRIHPDDVESATKELRLTLEGKKDFNTEFRIITPSGKIKYLKGQGIVTRDSNGNIVRLTGINYDITETKELEIKLKELTERLTLATDSAHIGVWDLYYNDDKLIWDDWCYKIYGVPNNTPVSGYSFWKARVYPDDLKKADTEFQLALKGKKDFNTEYRIVLPDDSIRYIKAQATVTRDDKGNPDRVIGINYDITERKLAEEALMESEERYQCLSEGSFEAIFLSEDGICTGQNSTAEKMFGYTLEEALGRPGTDWITHENRENVRIKMLENPTDPYEVTALRKNGNTFPCEIQAKMTSFKGKPLRITVLRDITERKKAEFERNQAMSELIMAKEKAEESDRLKSAFLANVSHEIRTPMNGIMGFAELLKKPDLSGKQQKEYISLIEKSGRRMLNIINDIMDISKIESGQMKLNVSPTDIEEIMENLFLFFKPETDAKGLDLRLKYPSRKFTQLIETDSEKLFAILVNLVKNSIKYTDSGFIEIGFYKENEKLCFYVKDSGIGIPSERLDAIFERFVQADLSPYKPFEGAGLGLAIAKAYVEMMGGTIKVESQKGKGSVFYFTIPKLEIDFELKNEKPKVKKEIKSKENGDLKILIVEDDNTSRVFLHEILKKYSKEIMSTNSGIEALEIFRNHPDINLIIMDLKLPDIDGYETTRRIRQISSDVKIIAETAYTMKDDIEKALKSGCNYYVSKPIEIDIFLNILNRISDKETKIF